MIYKDRSKIDLRKTCLVLLPFCCWFIINISCSFFLLMTITHIPAARVYKYWATLSSACNSCAIAAGPNQANLRLTRVYRLVYRLIFIALSLPLWLLTNSVCSQDVLELSVSAPVVLPFRHSLPRSARLPCPGRQMGQTVEVGSILFCFFFLGNHIRNLQPGNVANKFVMTKLRLRVRHMQMQIANETNTSDTKTQPWEQSARVQSRSNKNDFRGRMMTHIHIL